MVARLDANIFEESFADTYMNYRLGKTASMPKEVLANIRQFS